PAMRGLHPSIRRPRANGITVRDDAGAWAELFFQLWFEFRIDLWREREGHDGRARQIGREQIAFGEPDRPTELHVGCDLPGDLNQPRIQFDADGLRPVRLGGHDRNSSIPRAEAVD